MNRKRYRKRRKPYRNNNLKNKALSVVLVMVLSVAAGYLTAAHLLGPLLGLETEASFFDFINEEQKKEMTEVKEETETVLEDKIETETESDPGSGFALQYGSFSSKDGAQELVEELKNSGIQAEIIEKEGMFKVIGQLFETKEEARTYMDENSQAADVFITEIE